MALKTENQTCHICSEEIADNLELHVLSLHSQEVRNESIVKVENNSEETYQCNLCDKSFNNRGYLSKHVKHVHLNIERFACNLCEKTYSTTVALTRHQKAFHKGIRNYKCE